MNLFQAIGRLALSFINYLGQLGLLTGEIFTSLTKGQKRWRQMWAQVAEIGARSQVVVCVTGAFTGAVLAAQTLFQFKLFGLETATGGLVSVAMLRELGPSITGLMLAGRVGSAMAAEIGTMKVTEQIDALRSMAVHPVANTQTYVDLADVAIALIKGLSFGVLIVIISCDRGLKASNGAVGVGRGTTEAMVYSSLAILVVNFFLTLIMQIIFPASLFSS